MIEIFRIVLENNQLDEAFYFLIRNDLVSIEDTEEVLKDMKKYDNYTVHIHQLLVCYVRVLKKYLVPEFYPNFYFYKSKFDMLDKIFDRDYIVKDIYIALMKMEKMTKE